MTYYFMTNAKTHKDYIFKAESLKELAEKLNVKVFSNGHTAFNRPEYTDWYYYGSSNWVDSTKVSAIPVIA